MRGPRRCRLLPPCLLLVVLVCLPATLLLLTLVAHHPSNSIAAARHRSLHQQGATDIIFNARHYKDSEPNSVYHEEELEQQRNSSSGWGGGGSEAAFRQRMAARMTSRRHRLKAACTRLGLHLPANDSLHRPNPWEFLINRNYSLIWCNVFKAASTSWMYNFNILAGYKPQFLKRSHTVPLELARRRYPRPTLPQLQAALNDSLAFLVVRHPFERLLSAYRDKIQGAWPNSHHDKLGHDIVNTYRFAQPNNKEKNSKVSNKPRWPTFSEFVRYLIDVQRKGYQLDMHWTPITEFCTPCQIDFNIIAKFETLHEDQRYLIDLAGLGKIIKPEWKNASKGRVTREVIATHFSQLTTRQVLQLYNIYRFDFELFDYSLDSYIGMAKQEPSSPTSLP